MVCHVPSPGSAMVNISLLSGGSLAKLDFWMLSTHLPMKGLGVSAAAAKVMEMIARVVASATFLTIDGSFTGHGSFGFLWGEFKANDWDESVAALMCFFWRYRSNIAPD